MTLFIPEESGHSKTIWSRIVAFDPLLCVSDGETLKGPFSAVSRKEFQMVYSIAQSPTRSVCLCIPNHEILFTLYEKPPRKPSLKLERLPRQRVTGAPYMHPYGWLCIVDDGLPMLWRAVGVPLGTVIAHRPISCDRIHGTVIRRLLSIPSGRLGVQCTSGIPTDDSSVAHSHTRTGVRLS